MLGSAETTEVGEVGDTEDKDMGGVIPMASGEVMGTPRSSLVVRSSPVVTRIASIFDDIEDLELEDEDAPPTPDSTSAGLVTPLLGDSPKKTCFDSSPSSGGGSSSENPGSSSCSSSDDSSSKCSSGGEKDEDAASERETPRIVSCPGNDVAEGSMRPSDIPRGEHSFELFIAILLVFSLSEVLRCFSLFRFC